MSETNGASGFRRLFRTRDDAHIVALPQIGTLDDGAPFAVRFRDLRPMEWWANKFGEWGSIPMITPRPPDDVELDRARADQTEQMLEHYRWLRAIVGTAVTHFRDTAIDPATGAIVGIWHQVRLVDDGATEVREDPEDPRVALVPISYLEVGIGMQNTIDVIAAAIIRTANYGGNPIAEVPFRPGSTDVGVPSGSV